jgi:maltose alpha-D-glucosyltransferase/alpha-amylase
MIRSFHYAAYSGLFLNDQVRREDMKRLLPFAEQWYHYMSGFFMRAYLETVGDSDFIPKHKEDLDIMLQTYILEKAIYELGYELNSRPDWVIIPLKGIKAIMEGSRTARMAKV